MKRFIGPWLVLAMCAAACSEESGPNISGVPAFDIRRVEVTPGVDTIFIPDTVRATDRRRFTATAFGMGSERLNVGRYVWGSEDTTIAVVDSFGLVTPRRIGTTQISASATRIGRATLVVAPAATRILVSPGVDTIFFDDPGVAPGDTARLTAQTLDRLGVRLPGVRYSWQSSAPAVATVDSSGRVRAVAAGVATITVRAGTLQATATVSVLPIVRDVRVTSPFAQVLDGDTVQLTARAVGYEGENLARRYRWQSSNTSVAQVDSNGRVTFLAPGSATFTATTASRTGTVNVTALPRELQSVAVGDAFACGVASLGRGYCWGVDTVGQVGAAPDSACVAGSQLNCVIAPKRLADPSPSLSSVDAGFESACGIDQTGLLFCWGNSRSGQIGNGRIGVAFAFPTLATVRNERFSSVTVGGYHACALNLQGLAFCWGRDNEGQLGDNRRLLSSTPIPVVGLDGQETTALRYSAISAGAQHTCAVEQQSGRAYCWGRGASGQLGTGSTADSDIPQSVAGGLSFSRIAAGTSHTCGVTTAGALYCWGANDRGQLSGTGSTRLTPALVAGGFTDVSVGDDFTCALTRGGDIQCFGSNSDGQLGRGEASPSGFRTDVAPVVSGRRWTSVSAGTRSVCAIATDGGAWCWGSNVWGALGNSLQAAVRATPQRVARLR